VLIHISYIQAFADVNKRTARLLANIPLISQNYFPLLFNDIDLGDYRSAVIAVYELQDVRPLSDLYVYSYLRTCVAYDATVKSMGVDEVRVLYRLQRRGLIREVINRALNAKEVEVFIVEEAEKMVSKEHKADFIEDIKEDLVLMDESRIAGLGVSPSQLMKWSKIYKG
jgi:hypothetical protein